jgi:hypothetical protein
MMVTKKAKELKEAKEANNRDPTLPGPGPNQSTPKPTEVKVTPQPNKIKSEKEPSAPISEKPPFGLPVASPPHGVPTYNPNMHDLTPDKLVLPDNKRRKTNNQVPVKTQPTAQPMKQSVSQIKSEPAFKCNVPGCEFIKKGFTSRDTLERHIDDAHKEEDPENPLEFALEQARLALNLDNNGKAMPRSQKMEKSLSAQPMKKSISTQGPTPKMEAGTPMSRGTTHMSNLGAPRTPQSTSKALEKSTPTKDSRREPSSPSSPGSSWNDAMITPADLRAAFPTLETIQGALDLNGLTPASTLASGKSERNTPNSDVYDTENSNGVKIYTDNVKWVPKSFYHEAIDIDIDPSFVNDDILGMEWEEAFPRVPPPTSKKRKPDPNGGFSANLWSVTLSGGKI